MKYLILIIFAFLLSTTLQAQESLPANNPAIQKEVKALMEHYLTYSTFTTDGKSVNLDYIHKFSSLFYDTGDEALYMDLTPEKTGNKVISVEDYVAFIKMNYPQGISVKIDLSSLKISDAYQFKKKNTYRLNVMLTKNVFGFYQRKKIHDVSEKIAFQIIFDKEKDALTNFKIYKIEQAKNAEDISKQKELKFAMGIAFLPQQSSIYAENIKGDENWTTTNNMTFAGGLAFSIKVSKNINIITGAMYNSYSSTYALKDYNERSSESMVDQDNDTYYPDVQANLEEECVQNCIQIPLNLEYVFNPQSNLKFYAYAGASLSYVLSTQFNVKGDATTKGYYPDFNVLLEDIPEYGFESNSYDETGDWELNTLNFMANVGGGIMLSTGLKSVMKLGPNYSLSLNDLGYTTSKYNGDYLNINGDPGKTGVNGLGFMASMLWYF